MTPPSKGSAGNSPCRIHRVPKLEDELCARPRGLENALHLACRRLCTHRRLPPSPLIRAKIRFATASTAATSSSGKVLLRRVHDESFLSCASKTLGALYRIEKRRIFKKLEIRVFLAGVIQKSRETQKLLWPGAIQITIIRRRVTIDRCNGSSETNPMPWSPRTVLVFLA